MPDWMNVAVIHRFSPVCFAQQLSLGLLQALLVHLHLTHDHTRVLVWVLAHGAERHSPVVIYCAFSIFLWRMWSFTEWGFGFSASGCSRVLFQDRPGHLRVLCRRIDGGWRHVGLRWRNLNLEGSDNLLLVEDGTWGEDLEIKIIFKLRCKTLVKLLHVLRQVIF